MLKKCNRFFSFFVALLALLALSVSSAQEAPDALVKRVANEVIAAAKADAAIQSGDINRVMALVDSKVMPSINFERMTAAAVGRHWRVATPAQQKQLQDEFKTLLVRTYANALNEVKNLNLIFRPLRAQPQDTEVVVRSNVRLNGETIELNYRLEKTPEGWKIYDFNVLGAWLVETYRTQFAQEISAKGIDGLIATLAQRNKRNSAKAKN